MATYFPIGRLCITAGAIKALEKSNERTDTFVSRHRLGDWGDVDEEDKATNDRAVKEGGRLLSSYRLSNSTAIWIITEADRSVTTILLPEEY